MQSTRTLQAPGRAPDNSPEHSTERASRTPASVLAVAKVWDIAAQRSLVVQSGVPADVCYGVHSGMVALVHEAGCAQTAVDVLEPGQWFGGDVALAAETWLPSSLFVVRRADMQQLAERDAAVRDWLLASANARALRIAERLRMLTQAAPEQRVRWAIELLLDRFGHVSQGTRALGAALPQAQLARVAGTTRQTVNRSLMVLRRHGVLRIHQGRIAFLPTTTQ